MGQIEAYFTEEPTTNTRPRSPSLPVKVLIVIRDFLSPAQTGGLVQDSDALWMFLVTLLLSRADSRTPRTRSLPLLSFDLNILRHIQLGVSGHAEAEHRRRV